MLSQHSRRGARVDAAGELITLEEQDRSRWDRAEIDEATATARSGGAPAAGRALPAAGGDRRVPRHAPEAPPRPTGPNRGAVRTLLEVTANPVVKLNHAVAVAMAKAPKMASRSWTGSQHPVS